MTDNPLVEAVALAIAHSTKSLTVEDLAKHICTRTPGGASGVAIIEATAALRAIEDAGYRMVKTNE